MHIGRVEKLNKEEIERQIKQYKDMFRSGIMTSYAKKNIRKEIARLERMK